MDQKKAERTVKRMMESRAMLLRETPFFGYLLMHLGLACAPCGTACTDGSRLIFDPEFAEALNDRELQFVMLHEVLHCVLNHCVRGKELDSKIYNVACDIVVNSTIFQMWGLKTYLLNGEEPMHIAPDGKEGYQYNAEEIYEMLLKKRKPINLQAQFDFHDLWSGITDSNLLCDQWNANILEAGKRCGDSLRLPQSLRKLVEDLQYRSQVDWRQLLHDFIQQDDYDYGFLPPDRRFSDQDFFLPSYYENEENGHVGNVWVCVDTSASVSNRELTEILYEVKDAVRQVEMEGKISFFDSNITEPVSLTTEEDVRKIAPTGGGGTSFSMIFNYMQENLRDDLPKVILIFTDGYSDCPEEKAAMNVPVLWLITKDGTAELPWGTIVKLR